MKKIFIPVFAIIASMLCACEEEIPFTGDEVPSKLVLYSFAEPSSPLTVTLSQSLFFMESDYMDYGINKGYYTDVTKARRSVRYSVNSSESVDMTLQQEPDLNQTDILYGYGWAEEKLIIYGSDYTPKPGDHIRIDAEVEGFGSIFTEVDVPAEPRLEVTGVRRVPSSSDDTDSFDIELTLTLHDDGSAANFYRLEPMRIVPGEIDYYYSPVATEGEWILPVSFFSDDIIFFADGVVETVGGVIDGTDSPADPLFADTAINGRSHTFKIRIPLSYIAYINHKFDENGELVYEEWEYEEALYLRFSSLSESSYRYARSRDSVNDDLLEIFGEPVQLYNNVSGGIGCFSACTTTSIRVEF